MADGRDAKQRVFSKGEAYRVAADLGIHLSEHSSTGIGVIEALAGSSLGACRRGTKGGSRASSPCRRTAAA